MENQAKLIILLFLVNSAFEIVYEANTMCNKHFITTASDITKLINFEDLIYNYNSIKVLLNISLIVKTPSPGSSAHICLNEISSYEKMELTKKHYYYGRESKLYCIIYAGSFIRLKVDGKEEAEICSTRTFLKNRGSWFATNLVLLYNGTFLIYFETYKEAFMICNIFSFKKPSYMTILTNHISKPTEYHYDCPYFMHTLKKPKIIKKDEIVEPEKLKITLKKTEEIHLEVEKQIEPKVEAVLKSETSILRDDYSPRPDSGSGMHRSYDDFQSDSTNRHNLKKPKIIEKDEIVEPAKLKITLIKTEETNLEVEKQIDPKVEAVLKSGTSILGYDYSPRPESGSGMHRSDDGLESDTTNRSGYQEPKVEELLEGDTSIVHYDYLPKPQSESGINQSDEDFESGSTNRSRYQSSSFYGSGTLLYSGSGSGSASGFEDVFDSESDVISGETSGSGYESSNSDSQWDVIYGHSSTSGFGYEQFDSESGNSSTSGFGYGQFEFEAEQRSGSGHKTFESDFMSLQKSGSGYESSTLSGSDSEFDLDATSQQISGSGYKLSTFSGSHSGSGYESSIFSGSGSGSGYESSRFSGSHLGSGYESSTFNGSGSGSGYESSTFSGSGSEFELGATSPQSSGSGYESSTFSGLHSGSGYESSTFSGSHSGFPLDFASQQSSGSGYETSTFSGSGSNIE